MSLVLERGANIRSYGFDCSADVLDLRLEADEVSSREWIRSGTLGVRLRRWHVSGNDQRRFSVNSQPFL